MSANGLHLKNAPVMDTGMLIRKPVDEVFEALANPAITTKFWFTKSTGRLEPGAKVAWTWEMYGVTRPAVVREFVQNERIVVEWGEPPAATTVTFRFDSRDDGTTFLNVTEVGFTGATGDDVVNWALGSMGGFTQMLDALKAYLEHGIVVTIVADRFPDGHPG
jgi:uncharacterized protein YndB with AHSA1/START domain